jgi:hypothetical protein
MTDKTCTFCQKTATYAPIEEMELYSGKVYFCYDCQAEYIYVDDILSYTSLYTEIDGRVFRWSISKCGSTSIWRIIEPGIPAIRKNGRTKLVKYFDIKCGDPIQLLTPQNVNKKLKIWITFL